MISMLKTIIERIKAFVCSGLPKPISEEQHQAEIDENVRFIVSTLSRGNNSLQQGFYITESDINKLREKNYQYSFLK
jgi:hypothetical protein